MDKKLKALGRRLTALMASALLLLFQLVPGAAAFAAEDNVTIALSYEVGGEQRITYAYRMGYSGYEDAFWAVLPSDAPLDGLTFSIFDSSYPDAEFFPGNNTLLAGVKDSGSSPSSSIDIYRIIGDGSTEDMPNYRLYISRQEMPPEQPTEAPVTEAPVTEAPVTEAPVTEAPVTEAPVTEAPVTDAPVTDAPVTEAPVTDAPVTEAPVTEAPSVEYPIGLWGTAGGSNYINLRYAPDGDIATTADSGSNLFVEAGIDVQGVTWYKLNYDGSYLYVSSTVFSLMSAQESDDYEQSLHATEPPVTEAPVTEAPVTEAPVTEAPVTEAPVTEAPATDEPLSETPVNRWGIAGGQEYVNLRSAPGGDVIASATSNSALFAVSSVEKDGTWYKIIAGDTYMYISSQVFSLMSRADSDAYDESLRATPPPSEAPATDAPATEPPQTEEPVSEIPVNRWGVAGGKQNINLRSAPNGEIVATAETGTRLFAASQIEDDGLWYKIIAGDSVYYASSTVFMLMSQSESDAYDALLNATEPPPTEEPTPKPTENVGLLETPLNLWSTAQGSGSINLRETPDGKKIDSAESGTKLYAESWVQTENGDVWYKVRWNGGYLYASETVVQLMTRADSDAYELSVNGPATEAPTEEPTEAPTEVPTEAPTDVPTEVPTEEPTEAPTDVPTEVPATELPYTVLAKANRWGEITASKGTAIYALPGGDSLGNVDNGTKLYAVQSVSTKNDAVFYQINYGGDTAFVASSAFSLMSREESDDYERSLHPEWTATPSPSPSPSPSPDPTATPTPEPSPSPIPTEDITSSSVLRWAYVQAEGGLNVRQKTSTSSKKLGELKNQQMVFVYETVSSGSDDLWCRIDFDGKDGYVKAEYLRLLTEDASSDYNAGLTSPMPTPTPAPTDTPVPTDVPTEAPTDTPMPTDVPTEAPTDEPTEAPTDTPAPTDMPTEAPTDTPIPTEESTGAPTDTPEPAQYIGYALTITQTALRSAANYADSSILVALPDTTLVYVFGQSYIDSTAWSSVEVKNGSDARGLVVDTALRRINEQEADYYLSRLTTATPYITDSPEPTNTPEPTKVPEMRYGYAITLGDNVPMRNNPMQEAGLVNMLPMEEIVLVSGQEYDSNSQAWHVIQYKGAWGYVRGDQLRFLTNAETEEYLSNVYATPAPTLITTPEPYDENALSSYGYVDASSVNFRSSAERSNSNRIGTLRKYDFALVLNTVETNGETWYYINCAGKTGYVMSSYFKVLTLAGLEEFLNSDEFKNAGSDSTGTGSGSTGGSSGTTAVQTFTPQEDLNISDWKNPNLTVSSSYVPFDPNGTTAPTATPSAAPTYIATDTPNPFVVTTPSVTAPTATTDSGAPWGLIGVGAGLIAVAGGIYFYALSSANKKKAAARAAQYRARMAQQQSARAAQQASVQNAQAPQRPASPAMQKPAAPNVTQTPYRQNAGTYQPPIDGQRPMRSAAPQQPASPQQPQSRTRRTGSSGNDDANRT